ncbi:MAG: deoxyguanosine kinase [Sphingobacteriales bacterium]|jgi:deoxyguanosine kinase
MISHRKYSYYIGLGSNLENRLDLLSSGVINISKIGVIVSQSNWYETPSWGFEGEDFINGVVLLETKLEPEMLLVALQKVELEIGRKRQNVGEYENRLIDLDILYSGDLILEMPNLTIPHPQNHLRKFVLQPLAEIAPSFICPVHGISISKLLILCPDPTQAMELKNPR